MSHIASPIGNEITCVMYDIDDAVLNDVEKLEQALLEAASKENLTVLKQMSHKFEPYGFTAMLMIQESHIAIHTYPEYHCLVFNLYSCRGPNDGKITMESFKNAVKPKEIDLKERKIKIDSKE
ncbi:MAG: adenosylmethionine decarboxylase [Patescibacteria group bacterium]